MEFKLIETELRKEYNNYLTTQKEKIQTEEGLNWVVKWVLNKSKSFKGNFQKQKEKTENALFKYYEKALNEKMNKLKMIQDSKDFEGRFIITIEWRKNKTWRSNPKGFSNYGFEGSSIGGCGYDKRSTAAAEVLNSFNPLLKVLFQKEEKRLEELNKSKLSRKDKEKYLSRRSYIGYGSGYNVFPYFEGGVGISCFESIINDLGLKWVNVTDTENTDVYLIEK